MNSPLVALLVLTGMTTGAVTAAANPEPCFTITMETEKRERGSGGAREAHRIEVTYRPGTIGDDEGTYTTFTPADCSLQSMRAGGRRNFVVHEAHGEATGWQGSASRSASEHFREAPGNRYVAARVHRHDKGATVEFSVRELRDVEEQAFEYVGILGGCNWKKQRFELTETELGSLATLSKRITFSLESQEGCTGSGTATLRAVLKPAEERMIFEPSNAYASWLPTPRRANFAGIEASPAGQTLRVAVAIRPEDASRLAREGVIHFELEHDGDDLDGISTNWPRTSTSGPDLQFAPQSDQPSGIVVTAPRSAMTRGRVSAATVVIEALDTGARGRLTAKAPDLDLVAEYGPAKAKSLAIPLDDNRNGIADSWEMNWVGHLSSRGNEDEEVAPSQTIRGDGITLFEEYRGVVVIEGGRRVHRRLDPGTKEMFVIDPGLDFPVAAWKRLTHIQAHRVDEQLVDIVTNAPGSPMVNFNTADGRKTPFHALRLRVLPGDEDPEPAGGEGGTQPRTSSPDTFWPTMGYAVSSGPGIAQTEYVKVFPERARIYMRRRMAAMERGLAEPDSESGRALRDPANGFTLAEAAQALELLKTPAGFDATLRRIVNFVMVHEAGHACGGLDDHISRPWKPGERTCVMFSPDTVYQRTILVQTALGRGDADLMYDFHGFCSSQNGCAESISTKDW